MMSSVLVAALAVLVVVSAGLAAEPESKLPFGSKNTIVTIRLKSIDAALKGVSILMTTADPGLAAKFNKEMAGGLEKYPGIDRAKPFVFLFLDPDKFDDPTVGIFTLKDAKAFDEGVEEAPVKVVGNLGVIGEHEAALNEVADYLKAEGIKAIPVADMTDLAVVTTHAGDLMTRYKKQMRAGLEELKAEITGEEPEVELEDDADLGDDDDNDEGLTPKQKEMALKAIDYANKLIDGVEAQAGLLQLGASITADRLTIKMSAEATPETDFAAFLAKNNRPVNRALAKLLPKNAITSSISAFDPESVGKIGIGLVTIACDIFGLEAEETKRINAVLADAFANSSGLQAQAELPGKGGVRGITLQGIKDRDKAQAIQKAFFDLAKQGAIADFLKKYGVSVALSPKHREHAGIPIDQLEIAVDFDTLADALPLDEDDREEFMDEGRQEIEKALERMYGHKNKIVMEIAYGKSIVATTYGLNHATAMDRQIDLMRAGGAGSIATLPEYRAALESYPRSVSAFYHVSLFGKLQSFVEMMAGGGDMPFPPDMFPKRDELPAKEDPISGAVLVKGNHVVTEVRVPLKPVNALITVVKRKMMEKMMEGVEDRKGGDDEKMPVFPDEEF